MPTPLDRTLHSKNLFLGFAGMITAVAAWSIWGGDVFPAQQDPTGNETVASSSMSLILPIKSLRSAGLTMLQRGLLPSEKATREELLERVKANLRIPRGSKPSTS
ncbi:hypothetical protein N7492_009535 [Penicillium capsulatum]|uniref:Uncharacterized protein n=1 Tax=Penicillium capsulatum TaxID=69766 RepID=A0A9W9LI64_9EURO|nr:hypothetical protein N7492_009535 [Penicillium capsulatum]KAJ6106924.1 hypothetical protein N7512_010441 [Penicillium capsulatum]